MHTNLDSSLERVAKRLWRGPLRFEPSTGGLFNRVIRVVTPTGNSYLKQFTDQASSGSFPPLPTTAAQRCLVATSWHELALRASRENPDVEVPELEGLHSEYDLIAMKEVSGDQLYAGLVKGLADSVRILPLLVDWLASFHATDLQPRDRLLAASGPFKRFKVDLQYTQVLSEIPLEFHPAALSFIDDYLACEHDPVHGDINSRNVLVTDELAVAVIDFEQGHFGEGSYDLAYLLCEYVIMALRTASDPEGLLEDIWNRYATNRGWNRGGSAHRRWRIHLGFQTLYRLVGPSRKIWTGHLDEATCGRVREWSIKQLCGCLQ